MPSAFSANHGSPRILVTRRDNIGDLVCTTPLLAALRRRWPQAFLAVLASSYNQDVLLGNRDVDRVYVFPKRQQARGKLALLWSRWQLVREIRRQRFDVIVLANGGWRYARQLGARQLLGFRERDNPPDRQPDVVVPLAAGAALHEVEKMAALGHALGVTDALGPLCVYPRAEEVARRREELRRSGFDPQRPAVAIHISSRRPQQRWPEQHFIEFIRHLAQERPALQFLLFWSPGAENDPLHPGDDARAARILAATRGLAVHPCPTTRVAELIAALSLAERVICADGGALHVAAGLGKPILCFFGDSIVAEWRPWGAPYVLLQAASRKVADLSVAEVLAGFRRLEGQSGTADKSRET
ncbi:MAG: glycosyl transferase family 9 [Betaproteobacteria bacterium HGW-Betaproteobacteria-11]|nr:MAG: glycosyl transferase family 9 [Betaproteobacteria bacterium HGW-Betaproteobacteria-11]